MANKEKCHVCKGTGIFNLPTYWDDSIMDYQTKEVDCPHCDGTGRRVIQKTEFDHSDIDFMKPPE